MPLGSSGWYIPSDVMLLVLFFGLAVLGATFLQVIAWETAFQAGRADWLRQLRASADSLRQVRRLTTRAAQQDVELPLPPRMRRQWRMLRGLLTGFSVVQKARS